MAEIFSDGTNPVYEPVPEVPETLPEPTSTPVPTDTPVPEAPVSIPVDDQNGKTDLGNLPADEEDQEGLAEVPAEELTDQTDSVDYTELLTRQTEQLEALVLQDQKLNQNVYSILNVMPVLCVAMGMIAGILLLQILSYFFKH